MSKGYPGFHFGPSIGERPCSIPDHPVTGDLTIPPFLFHLPFIFRLGACRLGLPNPPAIEGVERELRNSCFKAGLVQGGSKSSFLGGAGGNRPSSLRSHLSYIIPRRHALPPARQTKPTYDRGEDIKRGNQRSPNPSPHARPFLLLSLSDLHLSNTKDVSQRYVFSLHFSHWRGSEPRALGGGLTVNLSNFEFRR